MINPHGLAIADTLLYVCEGISGLKVLNVKNPKEIELVNHITGFTAFDIIHKNNIAIINIHVRGEVDEHSARVQEKQFR